MPDITTITPRLEMMALFAGIGIACG